MNEKPKHFTLQGTVWHTGGVSGRPAALYAPSPQQRHPTTDTLRSDCALTTPTME